VGGVETVNDYDAWFNTQDLAREENGRYYILGRSDDLIVCENGENLNPVIVENLVKVKGVDDVCLIKSNGNPVLIASYPNCVSVEKAENVKGEIRAKLTENKLDGQVRKIEITTSPLMDSSDFKISRKKVAQKYRNGALKIIDSNTKMDEVLSEAEERVAKLFALALKTDDKIGLDSDFFTDLGGTSLDYFELVDSVKTEYGVDLPIDGGMSLTTVRQTCEFLLNNL
jgi:acyl carrier protein